MISVRSRKQIGFLEILRGKMILNPIIKAKKYKPPEVIGISTQIKKRGLYILERGLFVLTFKLGMHLIIAWQNLPKVTLFQLCTILLLIKTKPEENIFCPWNNIILRIMHPPLVD